MKRLCVFYRLADRFLGNKKIEWIVCKECQRLLIRGEQPKVGWQKGSQTERGVTEHSVGRARQKAIEQSTTTKLTKEQQDDRRKESIDCTRQSS
jgi:hypothetical protein